MPGILIIAHAPLASALRDCAAHVYAGCPHRLEALDVPPDAPPESLMPRAQSALQRVTGSDGAALLLVGLILLVLSVTRMLHWSTLLTPLLAGLLLRVRSQRPRVWPRHFGTAGGVLVVLLFLVLGLSLDWPLLARGLALGLALSLARALAKLAVPLALGRPSGLSWKQSAALGLALNPVAGVSFVLLLDLAHQVAGFPQALIAGAFAAIAVLELGGTLLARWVLGRAGDIPSKRKNP